MLKRRTGSTLSESSGHADSSPSKPSRDAVAPARSLVTAQSRLLKLSLLVRLLAIFLLLTSSAVQQAFDTSPNLLSYSLDPQSHHGLSSGPFKWLLFFVRWDTIYFLSSASPDLGYQWEQSLAFQPGIIALLRLTGYVTPSFDGKWSPTAAVLGTTLLANIAATLAPVLLFRLTWRITKNKELAVTAATLSIFAPSAGTTLTAPTPDGFFSLASLMGMLCLESSPNPTLKWRNLMGASFWFAVATAFRSNGALLVGYIAYKLLAERSVSAMLKLMVSSAICIPPSVLFQAWAYSRYCLSEEVRPWCTATPPSVYTFVQSHYWNVGFLRYWELSQLPNFLLAAPVLTLVAYTTLTFYRDSSWSQTLASLFPSSPTSTPKATSEEYGLTLRSAPKAVPYVVHALVLGLILLFASHVQIALRLATPGGMPAVWWGAAHLTLYSRGLWVRRLIVGYLAMQYCVAIVLYAGFYPPA